MNRNVDAYELGHVLGYRLAVVMRNGDARHTFTIERAGHALIDAVRAAVIGDEAGDAYQLDRYAEGVRAGGYAARHDAAIGAALARGLEAIDEAARA